MKCVIFVVCCFALCSAVSREDLSSQADPLEEKPDEKLPMEKLHDLWTVSKRQTSVEGHASKDPWGNTHVGGSFQHKSGDNSWGASVDHTVHGGTDFGLSGSHTWKHSDGSKTTLSGGLNHNSHGGGYSGGLSLTHNFGRRMVRLEKDVQDLKNRIVSKRQTTVEGHVSKDASGTHYGGSIDHKSGHHSWGASVDHTVHGGTSANVHYTYHFGKRLAQLERQISSLKHELFAEA